MGARKAGGGLSGCARASQLLRGGIRPGNSGAAMTRIREAATFMGAIAVAAVATLACSTESTIIHVTNESAVTLESVVLSGSGFRVTAPDIPAGGSIDVLVSSRGESGLAVSCIAAGREISMPEQGYFEGGGSYAGDVIIKSDLSVSVEFRLAVY